MQSEYKVLKNNFLGLPKNSFQLIELALARLAITTNNEEDLELYFNELKFYENIQSLVDDHGISGEWAFTVLNYLLAVHCLLVTVDERKAFLLRNFIFKNFAYKLRGSKRVVFMATLFIGLQYDCEFENGKRWVIGIGKYFFEKFFVQKYVKTAENRVYVAFVMLCFAHIYAIVEKRCEEHDEMIWSFRDFHKANAHNLWDFASVLCKCITSTGKVPRTRKQVECFERLGCKKRRKIAFVASRLREPEKLKTKSVRRWLRYISDPEE